MHVYVPEVAMYLADVGIWLVASETRNGRMSAVADRP